MQPLRKRIPTIGLGIPWAALAIGVVLGGACDRRPATAATVAPVSGCPACECKCSCPASDGAVAPSGTPTSAASDDEAAELTFDISRKIGKRDATCLADFDRLAEIAPRTAARMGLVRGQCLMLAGRCDAGAAVVRSELGETTELLVEQLDRTVETYTGMYCTGPLDDRNALLRALTELQKGAYQGNIGIRACNDAARTVSRLRGRVKPKNDEDTQIRSLDDYFGYVAAGCLARAGDCGAAWKVFNDEFRVPIADPKVRAEAIRTSFDSAVGKCKGRQ